jgi:hypothetical protein
MAHNCGRVDRGSLLNLSGLVSGDITAPERTAVLADACAKRDCASKIRDHWIKNRIVVSRLLRPSTSRADRASQINVVEGSSPNWLSGD